MDGEGGSEHVLLPDKDLLRFSLPDYVRYAVQAGFPAGPRTEDLDDARSTGRGQGAVDPDRVKKMIRYASRHLLA